LILGLLGTGLLLAPLHSPAGAPISLVGASAVLLASFGWAGGSLYSRSVRLPGPPLLSTGMQLLAGGGLLLIAGLLAGEWHGLNLAKSSLRSWLAVAYLLVFGSLIGFTAYIWLLKVTTPARASTYAYVNPVVAVLLGWLFAGEVVTIRMTVAAVVIVAAVILIISRQEPSASRNRQAEEMARSAVLQKDFCLNPGSAEADP
jgi:drug/metabolite transporter (DMT)-like permease